MIHEVGHALYQNGIAPELERTPLCRSVSLGFDESQSRLWENWVGRGRPFLAHLHPLLAELFPERFAGIDREALYRAANRVEPSLIRVEADEVTYNLHIALRFELELELFDGPARRRPTCPQAWAQRMSELPRDRGARRRRRGAPGRALVGGLVRLLPHLLARQRDRRPALGAGARRAAGPRRAARRRRARSRCATSSASGSTATAASSSRRR